MFRFFEIFFSLIWMRIPYRWVGMFPVYCFTQHWWGKRLLLISICTLHNTYELFEKSALWRRLLVLPNTIKLKQKSCNSNLIKLLKKYIEARLNEKIKNQLINAMKIETCRRKNVGTWGGEHQSYILIIRILVIQNIT